MAAELALAGVRREKRRAEMNAVFDTGFKGL
jgi:hypothetical protein